MRFRILSVVALVVFGLNSIISDMYPGNNRFLTSEGFLERVKKDFVELIDTKSTANPGGSFVNQMVALTKPFQIGGITPLDIVIGPPNVKPKGGETYEVINFDCLSSAEARAILYTNREFRLVSQFDVPKFLGVPPSILICALRKNADQNKRCTDLEKMRAVLYKNNTVVVVPEKVAVKDISNVEECILIKFRPDINIDLCSELGYPKFVYYRDTTVDFLPKGQAVRLDTVLACDPVIGGLSPIKTHTWGFFTS